jgi:hypothetical protein
VRGIVSYISSTVPRLVKERTSETTYVPTLQVFSINKPQVPYSRIQFLAIPFNAQHCTSYYSDIIACSSKLMHLTPAKNAKEFQVPTACIFHMSSAYIVTAVGKTLLKYDVSKGEFVSAFPPISSSDVTAIASDGFRGRRLYCANSRGELLLVSFTDGCTLDQVDGVQSILHIVLLPFLLPISTQSHYILLPLFFAHNLSYFTSLLVASVTSTKFLLALRSPNPTLPYPTLPYCTPTGERALEGDHVHRVS